MKKAVLFIVSILFVQISFAQWAGMGSGPGDKVRALCVHKGSLYAGGDFSGLVKKWDGASWVTIGSNLGTGKVYALISYNDTLYAGGDFSVSGTFNIAKWNGSSWVAVGNGLGPNTFPVYCLYNYKGVLLAGGRFTTSGVSSISKVAKLVSGAWQQVGGGAPSKCTAGVYCMTSHSGELYVGGQGSAPWINKLDVTGTSWLDLPAGGPSQGVGVYALASFIYPSTSSPGLFVGGDFANVPSSTVCLFSSNTWGTATNPFTAGVSDQVNCFISTSVGTGNTATGTIYAGGVFSVSGLHTAVNLAKRTRTLPWDTTGTPTFNNGIRALCYYNGYLVAGGDFTAPGNFVARYATTVGINENPENILVNMIYPNPVINEAVLKVQTKTEMFQPELKMMDVNGNEIENHSSMTAFNKGQNEIEFRIDRSDLSAGIYYYMLLDNERNIATGKLIVE